jgi:hypothetical protein
MQAVGTFFLRLAMIAVAVVGVTVLAIIVMICRILGQPNTAQAIAARARRWPF